MKRLSYFDAVLTSLGVGVQVRVNGFSALETAPGGAVAMRSAMRHCGVSGVNSVEVFAWVDPAIPCDEVRAFDVGLLVDFMEPREPTPKEALVAVGWDEAISALSLAGRRFLHEGIVLTGEAPWRFLTAQAGQAGEAELRPLLAELSGALEQASSERLTQLLQTKWIEQAMSAELEPEQFRSSFLAELLELRDFGDFRVESTPAHQLVFETALGGLVTHCRTVAGRAPIVVRGGPFALPIPVSVSLIEGGWRIVR